MTTLAKEIPNLSPADRDRFYAKVRTDASGCHVWTGCVLNTGYGQFTIRRRGFMAHRVALALVGRRPPRDLVVDHICRNTRCVNPGHLRLVTIRVNCIENSDSVSARALRRSACPKCGGAFSRRASGRFCLACCRENDNRLKRSQYATDPAYRGKISDRNRSRREALTVEQREILKVKMRDYMREYVRRRGAVDPEFLARRRAAARASYYRTKTRVD